MAQQTINVGAAQDDGTGDPARTAFTKCNANFTELYTADTTFLTTTVAAATYQPLDADLTALAALTGTNTIYYRSATNVWSPVVVSTGMSFSGGNLTCTVSTAGLQPLDTTLTALAGYNTNGLLTQTAADTFTGRTLTGAAAGITVSNGNGVAGNPTLALADDLAALEALTGTNTIYYRSGTSAWTAVTIGTNLTFTGGTLSAAGGGGGDVFLAASNPFTGALNTFTGADTVFGHTAAVDASNKIEVHGTDSTVGVAIEQWSNDGNLPHLHFRKSRGTTPGTHGIVSAGDTLGQINWNASDGSAFPGAAAIQGVIDGTPSAGVMPGMLQFLTRGTSGGNTERMRIGNAGTVTIGPFATPYVTVASTGITSTVDTTSPNYPAGAWTAWTPTISASSGTITSTTINVARYTRHGKTVTAFLDVTITNAGTGAGDFRFTLPVAALAAGGGIIIGREVALTGVTIAGVIISGGLVGVSSYTGTTVVATNYRNVMTAIYEVS